MSDHKVILAVLAHPDDESFGMGGTLAYYSTQGVDVHLICATRGEAGTVDPEFLENHKDIAALREEELRCAAKTLGLASVIFLDYRDSGMPGSEDNRHPNSLVSAPLEQVAEKVVHGIRRLRPQVVLTFDPVGGYHHPDHIAIHNATVQAFHAAGDGSQFPHAGNPFQPERLYYNALNRRRLRWLVRMMRLAGKDPSRVGRNKDIDLTALARDQDTPPHVSINYRSVEKRKHQADACHASQLDGRFSRFSLLELYWRLTGRRDTFTRAFPPVPDQYRSTDLFA
ncbi:MAG TPA: PIG-L family deacetylase [Anaerolineales bacterium]|nr:PIG-L family deacetylase [Anaerolineales bacterium]